MPITLSTTETRRALDEARLVNFTANVELRYAQAIFEVGYRENGTWAGVRKVVVEWGENGEYPFSRLIQEVPEARQLARALEQWAVTNGKFSGVVS